MYRISLFIIAVGFIIFALIQLSCRKDDPAKPLTVKTLPVSDIFSTTAKSGGYVTDDGGSYINSKGIVWSTDSGPTIESHAGITMDGIGQGVFVSTLTNLSPETQYYVRAYATNSACRTYGDQETFITSFTDIPTYPPGYVHCNPLNPTDIVEAVTPATGRIWMDRNLGASQVATGSADANSYGDLYQWGRFADGHQCRNSATTSALSNSDQPSSSNFILAPNSPYDWRSPQNDDLWQAVSRVNNPCPTYFRLPTRAEWIAELMFWSNHNAAEAMASQLKLPLAGFRGGGNGSLYSVGSSGFYWSGTVNYFESHYLYLNSNSAEVRTYGRRANGFSIRCIKDHVRTETE